MDSVYALVLILTAGAALFALPLFWLWAWALGPAVTRLGRNWEAGKLQAYEKHRQALEKEYRRGVDDALDGRVQRVPVTPATFKPDTGTATAPTPKYTLTGREIR